MPCYLIDKSSLFMRTILSVRDGGRVSTRRSFALKQTPNLRSGRSSQSWGAISLGTILVIFIIVLLLRGLNRQSGSSELRKHKAADLKPH